MCPSQNEIGFCKALYIDLCERIQSTVCHIQAHGRTPCHIFLNISDFTILAAELKSFIFYDIIVKEWVASCVVDDLGIVWNINK